MLLIAAARLALDYFAIATVGTIAIVFAVIDIIAIIFQVLAISVLGKPRRPSGR